MPNQWIFVYSEGHSLLMNNIWFYAFTNKQNIPGILNEILYINKQGVQTCYTTKKELERVKQQGRIFFNKNFQVQFTKRTNKVIKDFEKLTNRLRKIELSKCSDRQLLELFEEYVEKLSAVCAYYQVGGGRSFPLLEKYAREKLLTCIKDNFEEYYNLLLSSPEVDVLEKEEYSLLKLGKNPTNKQLLDHADNFSFLVYNTYNREQICSFFRKKLDELQRQYSSEKKYLQEKQKIKNNLKKKQQQIENKITSAKLLNIIQFLKEQGRLRFEYREWKGGGEYKFLPLFEEIAKRISIAVEDYLRGYTIKDAQLFLKQGKKVSKQEIERRKEIVLFIKTKGKSEFLTGNNAEKTAENFLKDNTNLSELKGMCASPGYAKGIAKVIIPKGIEDLEQDMKNFKKGEILITTMTQPNMVVIMKKARAIVTDQGGITSHAAVISRELKVPCIVGTYKATKVFKTGERIEVDADKGSVKKLP